MKRAAIVIPFIVIMLLVYTHGSLAATRPVSAEDCVEVKYPFFYDNNNAEYGTIKISPTGDRVAFLVKAPRVTGNYNRYELYVRSLGDTSRQNGRLITTGLNMSHIEWTDHGQEIAVLKQTNGRESLVSVNVTTGTETQLIEASQSILEYQISARGDVAVFTLQSAVTDQKNQPTGDAARGYRQIYLQSQTEVFPKTHLMITKRGSDGKWTPPLEIGFKDPLGSSVITQFPTYRDGYSQHLSMSPDGKHLLFSYTAESVPSDWEEDPYVKEFRKDGSALMITALYDVDSKRAILALNSSTALTPLPVWSPDSRYFVLNAPSPIGSKWRKEDIASGHADVKETHLFRVDVSSGKIEEILQQVEEWEEGALSVEEDGTVLIASSEDSEEVVDRYSRKGSGWQRSERIKVPVTSNGGAPVVSDGKEVIGVYETSTVPPDLYLYTPGATSIRLLTRLNPQLEDLRFSTPRTVHWVTGDGVKISGLLFEPSGYVRGQRYPLVIQTKGLGSSFACDSGGNTHDPGFAPQPIASAGMFYLSMGGPRDPNQLNELETIKHYSKTYPGGLGEAAHQMDIWESAIQYLDLQGEIDPEKVGIIGFSRSGWYVEFELVQSKVRFAAASIEDNVLYSVGEYFLLAKTLGTSDSDYIYGGPPYGPSLGNWLRYSISFNMDKIHTPLLMETMGYGVHDDTPSKLPLSLAGPTEVFVGLNRLSKPVEWYYYPDDVHQPESPVTRLASIQRNVDWYRFWLQGYERPNPEDRDQYVRWEHLRDLRDADYKAAGIPLPDSAEQPKSAMSKGMAP